MVYCPKCGTLNDDTAEFCVKCGASLRTGTFESRRYERRKAESECFGLPHGGAIVGLAIGAIILIWGAFTLAQETHLINFPVPDFWIIVLVVIGVLLIAGAVYQINRRPRPTAT